MIARAVVVAHREAMVAEGISAALARYPGIVSLGATTAAGDAERLGAQAYAVAIDPELPGAFAAAGRLRRMGVRVVFLGEANGSTDDGSSEDREEQGVRVPTHAPIATLAAALAPGSRAPEAAATLTEREQEILRLIAKGRSGKQVAKQLGISPKTVERHKTRIFSKLGVPNQAAAAFLFGERIERSRAWSASTT
jgi:DNA-binding CsgD family transcriptional regulator